MIPRTLSMNSYVRMVGLPNYTEAFAFQNLSAHNFQDTFILVCIKDEEVAGNNVLLKKPDPKQSEFHPKVINISRSLLRPLLFWYHAFVALPCVNRACPQFVSDQCMPQQEFRVKACRYRLPHELPFLHMCRFQILVSAALTARTRQLPPRRMER